ncbi:OmpA family protein [Fulvivirga lutimaris]|uniref:OmpA family protein n=1 Tax=Fulvivirga lutimaris TaxID=1819566 RepID=UPI0012BC8708|nr:OmpA family protein [Fulvivirga lutimaris]MTI39340.1 OmpA family protein [Fulvivirga lutimaris]
MTRSLLSTLLFITFLSAPAFSQETDSLIRKSIFFGGGSYYIDEYQSLELQDFILNVEKLENYEIVLFSHTDNIGGKEYNEWLSFMRSTAVQDKLIEIGIAEELMEIKNFGMNNPLYRNSSYKGRHMNRRVDVILVPIVF